MAQVVTYWKMDGSSDIELGNRRLRSKADIAECMANVPSDCDLVTLGRTDGQSGILHEIWKSPLYIDLNSRVPESKPLTPVLNELLDDLSFNNFRLLLEEMYADRLVTVSYLRNFCRRHGLPL